MVIEGLKEILDVEGLIHNYGKFVPIFLFIYLSFREPTFFHFVLLGISIILCLTPPHFVDTTMEFFNKKGNPKYKKILQSNKKKQIIMLCFVFLTYFILIGYTLYLLILRAKEMITNGVGDIILILLLMMNIGIFVVIFIPFFKQIKAAKKEVLNDVKDWINRKGSRLNNSPGYDNCINDLADFHLELKRKHKVI